MSNTLQQQQFALASMTEDTFDQAFLDPVLFGDDQPQDALSFSHAQTTMMHKHSYIPPSQRNILNSPLDLDMSLCETPASIWETPIDSPLTMYSSTPYIPPTPFYTPMISGQDTLEDCSAAPSTAAMSKSPFIADEGYYTSHMSPFVAGFDGNPLTLINEKAAHLAQEQNQQIVYVGEQTTHLDNNNNNSLFVPLDDCMPDGNSDEPQNASQRSLFDVVDDIFNNSQNVDQLSGDDKDNDEDYVPTSASTPNAKRKKSSSTRDATGRPLKRFQCPRKGCGMMFSRRFNLQTHMRVHDPNRLKLFRCEVEGCGKNFDRRHDLTRHEATVHRGERAYHCEFCEKPFSRKDALVRHLTVKGCPNQMGAM